MARAVAEVLPDLRANHHLAGGAFAVDAFGEGGAAGPRDAVEGGEGGLADGGAEGVAIGGERVDAGLGGGGLLGAADAFALEVGLGGGEGLAGLGELLLEELGARHGVELGVFDARDLAGEEGDLVLEGGGLGGGRDDVHLLTETGAPIFEGLDVGLLGATEFFFFGDGVFEGDAGGLGLGGFRGEGGDAGGDGGDLFAKFAELEIEALEGDEFFEIGVQMGLRAEGGLDAQGL